jgi:hypothetical protein
MLNRGAAISHDCFCFVFNVGAFKLISGKYWSLNYLVFELTNGQSVA